MPNVIATEAESSKKENLWGIRIQYTYFKSLSKNSLILHLIPFLLQTLLYSPPGSGSRSMLSNFLIWILHATHPIKSVILHYFIKRKLKIIFFPEFYNTFEITQHTLRVLKMYYRVSPLSLAFCLFLPLTLL